MQLQCGGKQNPKAMICQAAAQEHADHVVRGCRGRGHLKKVISYSHTLNQIDSLEFNF